MQKRVFFLICTFLVFTLPLRGQQNYGSPKITDALGNEDAVINCGYPINGNCFDLKVADYPTLYGTTSYTVSAENFTPPAPFNAGTSLNADADDSFLKKIPIPFSFCYFGNNYNEVVIGSNGVLTFDVLQVGNSNYPNVVNSNPSITLPKSTIFGVYSDLIFSKNDVSEIYYSVVGTAPFRKFVVNFYKGKIVGCDTQSSTSQIVLSEGSNTIEIFVENKPLICNSAKFKNSLLGIMNEDGTVGYSPPGRNTGKWQATNEAWKFTPSGAAVVPRITWFNGADEIMGTGETINVCPKKNELYSVQVSYDVCGSTPVILKDTFAVTFGPDYPIAVDVTDISCSGTSANINLDDYRSELTPQPSGNFIFTFHLSQSDAESGADPQPKNFVLTGNTTFYVRIQNPADPACYQTSVLNLTLLSRSLLTDKIDLCDINNDNIEKDFELSTLNPDLFSLPLDGTLHYYKTAADATNEVNEITTLDLVNGIQFYVRYKTKSCSAVFGPVTINFLSSPLINTIIDYPFTTCDYGFDLSEPFDFLLNLRALITSNPNAVLSFFGTYQAAYLGDGTQLTTIREGEYEIFVRVQIPGERCFSIATVKMKIIFTKVEAVNASQEVCFSGSPSVVKIDLDDYSLDMLQQSSAGIIISYFATNEDAVANINAILNSQNVTIDSNFVSKVFYVRFTDPSGCFALKTLELNLRKIDINKQVVVCDLDGDGAEAIVLSALDQQIIGSQNATVIYFATLAEAQSGVGIPITSLTINGSTKIGAIVKSTCAEEPVEISITLGDTPVIAENPLLTIPPICDNNNDGQEPFDLTQFESEIYAGPESYAFNYFKNYDVVTNSFSGFIEKPKVYPVSGKTMVYVKVENAGGCFSVSTLDLQINFLPVIVLKAKATLKKCDFEQDSNELFDLKDALPQLFVATQNSYTLNQLSVTYYKTKKDAEQGLPSKQIPSTFTTSTSGTVTLWARFTSNTEFCYSVAAIDLVTAFPPKARKSTILVCDDNLDGLFVVDLTAFTANMIFDPINVKDYTFSFFLTEAEAQNLSSKPLGNPAKFSFPETVKRIWVRVENAPGCFDIEPVDFDFGPKVILNADPIRIVNVCDAGNDGIEQIDLTQYETAIYNSAATFEYYQTLADLNNYIKIEAPQSYIYNENSGLKKIFVKVTAPGFCPEKVEIDLVLNRTPMFTLPEYFFCAEGSVNISPDFSGLDLVAYEWRDPAGVIVSNSAQLFGVKITGVYQLKVTARNNCTFTTDVIVKVYEVPTITNLTVSGNSITVTAEGDSPIEYSRDGVTYQASNVFYNLPLGITTFYARFTGSFCQGDSKKGLILVNAFSPNADGINDTWVIDNLDEFGGGKVNLKVFDRFKQKVYEQESATRLEWNGQTLSRVVPTGSYWYQLTLPDGLIFTGWVMVKNRN